MADGSVLRNPLYRNWVRAALGLKYLQQGLAGYVNNLSDQRHQSHLYSYRKATGSPAHSCNECTADNLLPEHPRKTCIQKYRSKCFCNSPVGRRPCPNNFCSRFYDLIVLDHDERNPVWFNTDPSFWYSQQWSFARCFLATAGYSDKHSAAETDAAGLLCILLNNVEFRASLDDLSKFEVARNSRNDVVHSATFEIKDEELTSVIEQFIGVLQDKRLLINDVDAQQAVSNLDKLKRDEVNINCQIAEELRREAMQAIAEKKDEVLREIDQKTFESIQQITEAQSQAAKILKTTQTPTVENHTALSDKEKRELQRYLIDFYRRDYLKTDISPLLSAVEIDVDKVYVPLKMDRRKGNSVETERVNSLRDIFYCKDKQAQTIYISGDAGMGKTTFGRKLISEWCHAHSLSSDISPSISSDDTYQKTDAFFSVTPHENITDCSDKNSTKRSGSFDEISDNQSYSDGDSFDSMNNSDDEETVDDISNIDEIVGTIFSDTDKSIVMKQFEFLFFVSLRDTYKERSVEEMAQNQLLKTKKMRDLFLNLVENEPECILYILDGLDEWTPPTPLPKHPTVTKGLPLSSFEGNNTILFTSRPWKIETLRPKLGECDFDISILGIEESASKRLVWLIFDKIVSEKDEIDTNAVLFLQQIEKLNIECLSSVPLLLKLLICLWEKEHDLPDSQTGIYSSIINKLCSLAMKRHADSDKYQHWTSQLTKKNLKFPPALDEYTTLLKFSALIYTLGKFSFKKLSPKIKSGALVFKDKDLTDHGISEAEYELSLMIGLLSQKKVIGSLQMSPVRCVSFMHKTFQEYFAALYISMVFEQNMTATANVRAYLTDQNTTVVDKVREYFSSAETAINVIQVLAFVKEMCPAINDHVTGKIDINEKDFMITIDRNKLTLQTNMNNNTKLVTEFFMTHHIHKILVKSSFFGKHDLQLQTEMRNLESLELHTVKLTSSALKRMLESLPETSSGISLKLCHVVVRSPRRDGENVNVAITLKNLKSIEIEFMNLCGIKTRFSEHMKTMKLFECDEVNMNEKEFEQLFDNIPDTGKKVVFKFSELRLKNVVNEDSNILIKIVKRSKQFQKCTFTTKQVRSVTFWWLAKELICKNICISEVEKPMVDLFSHMKYIISADNLAAVGLIKTLDSSQDMNLLDTGILRYQVSKYVVKNPGFSNLFQYIFRQEPSVLLYFEIIHETDDNMTEIHLDDQTLTTHAFRALIECRNRKILSIVLDKITLVDTFNLYTEVIHDYRKNLTIRRTNLLDIGVIFDSKWYYLSDFKGSILFENVILTEKAFCAMKKSALKVFRFVNVEEQKNDVVNSKTITWMRIGGLRARHSFLFWKF